MQSDLCLDIFHESKMDSKFETKNQMFKLKSVIEIKTIVLKINSILLESISSLLKLKPNMHHLTH